MNEGSEATKPKEPILRIFDEKDLSFLGAIFNIKGAKILYLLYSISPNTKTLRYSDISEHTGLGTGNQLYYPLQNLQKMGLVSKNQINKHTVTYSLTGAGYLAAELLHNMIKDLVRNADRLPVETKEFITSVSAAVEDVERKLKILRIPINTDGTKKRTVYLRKRY